MGLVDQDSVVARVHLGVLVTVGWTSVMENARILLGPFIGVDLFVSEVGGVTLHIGLILVT